MTHVVAEPCVKCKYTDCVDVCPVDCIHPRKDEPEFQSAEMLYIHPDECIDCGVCEPECPAEAIVPDTDGEVESWVKLNREYAEKWPNISRKGEPPADADDFRDVEGKFEKYFSAEPAKNS